MNEEMETATPAEQVTAESGATEVEQQATPEATTEQTQEQQQDDPNKDEEAKKVPWFQKRINEQTRKYYEAQREAQELRQRLAQLEQPQYQESDQQQQQAPQMRPEEVMSLAEQIAAKTLAERSFNDQCNRVYQTGSKELPDFDAAVSNLQLVGVTREFLDAATASDAGHKLLHHLGQIENLPEAERILKLPPVQMGRELARLEAKLTAPPAPKPVSKAPAPITPVGTGKATESGIHDDLPMEEWMRRRRESLRKNVTQTRLVRVFFISGA